jgi:hypothetical protein
VVLLCIAGVRICDGVCEVFGHVHVGNHCLGSDVGGCDCCNVVGGVGHSGLLVLACGIPVRAG